ncbi:MAG: response regulator [bacterium]|nr:response regulator [bacterium]
MKKIMVVDDEENIRFLYKEELMDEGYDVVLAASGQEALDLLGESKPDLITLDIKMPGMDGIETLRKMKEIDKDLPVVLCTAYGQYKQDFSSWASDAYVVKSADLDELKSVIKEIMESKG